MLGWERRVWSELRRRGGCSSLFNSLSIVMEIAKEIDVDLKRSSNNILGLIYTLELLKWICLLGSFLPERPLLADQEIYTLIFLFIFLVSDQSCTIPTQGETHQSVIPPLSMIHRKLRRHTDGQADKQKDSINKRVKGKQTAAMPGEINLLYCQSSRAKQGGKFTVNTTPSRKIGS